jgi:hypothetical protein
VALLPIKPSISVVQEEAAREATAVQEGVAVQEEAAQEEAAAPVADVADP